MACCCKCIMFISLIVLACLWVYRKIKNFFTIPDVPKLEDTWWGPGDPQTVDISIKEFKINIAEDVSTRSIC